MTIRTIDRQRCPYLSGFTFQLLLFYKSSSGQYIYNNEHLLGVRGLYVWRLWGKL